MYQLEISEAEIQKAIKYHIANMGDIDETEANNTDSNLIREFANKVKIFYDDDMMGIYNKTARDNYSHHFYRVLITSGKWRVMTEIGLPTLNDDPDYRNMNLHNAISALSFEVSDPEDYMEESEDSPKYKKAVKRYKKVSQKIYDKFGESFYCFILGGSI